MKYRFSFKRCLDNLDDDYSYSVAWLRRLYAHDGMILHFSDSVNKLIFDDFEIKAIWCEPINEELKKICMNCKFWGDHFQCTKVEFCGSERKGWQPKEPETQSSKKKIYIAGKITGDSNYRKKFKETSCRLEQLGYSVMNPATLPDGFTWEEYMTITLSMLDVCDLAYFLNDWNDSKGAMLEYGYAVAKGKEIMFAESFLNANSPLKKGVGLGLSSKKYVEQL